MLRGFFSSQPFKNQKTFWSSNVQCQILECREVFSSRHSKVWKTSCHSKVRCQTLERWEVFSLFCSKVWHWSLEHWMEKEKKWLDFSSKLSALQSSTPKFGALSKKKKWPKFRLQTLSTPKFRVEVLSAKQKKRKTLLNATWFQLQNFGTSMFNTEVWSAQWKKKKKKH